MLSVIERSPDDAHLERCVEVSLFVEPVAIVLLHLHTANPAALDVDVAFAIRARRATIVRCRARAHERGVGPHAPAVVRLVAALLRREVPWGEQQAGHGERRGPPAPVVTRHGLWGCATATSQPTPVPRTAPPRTSVGKWLPPRTRSAPTLAAPAKRRIELRV